MATVLAVDDEEDILTIIRHNLEREGHRVLTAPNGDRAIELVREEKPDVVVLDVMMPGLGGSALASLIAKLELPHAPRVLLWSAMDDTALAEAAQEAGGLPWISKAMRASEIAAEIERLAVADQI
jgi:two-component system, OmpR family, alkaline phosphatase synthesis response regulator PhoP